MDLHIHSIASGHAFNTIEEIIRHCCEKQYTLIGFSDHGPSMEGASHEGYFEMFSRLPRQRDNTKILYGCESNIMDDSGHIDLSASTVSLLDYVIGGLHKRTPYQGTSIKHNTTAIIETIKTGMVDIISHPFSFSFYTDVLSIVEAAKENGVILELNKTILLEAQKKNDSDVISAYKALIDKSMLIGTMLLFGSDAHYFSEIGLSETEQSILKNTYNISFSYLLNSDEKSLLKVLNQRRENRKNETGMFNSRS